MNIQEDEKSMETPSEEIEENLLIEPKHTNELCLKGVNKYARDNQIRKELSQLLGDQMVQIASMTKPKMKPFCFLTFNSIQDKLKFQSLIDQTAQRDKNRGGKLRVGEVNQSSKFDRKKLFTERQEKRTKDEVNQIQIVQEKIIYTDSDLIKQTAQLYNVPYDKQIELKQNEFLKVLEKFRNQYIQKLPKDEPLPQWIHNSQKDIKQLTNIRQPIQCNEQYQFNYRNKTEFTIGYNTNGQLTVGFNMGSYQQRTASVEKVSKCVVTPKIALNLAEQFEKYISLRTENKLVPFDRSTGEGFWRIFCIRKSDRTKQIILIVSVNKNGGSQEDYDLIRKELLELFLQIDYEDFKLKGIILINSSQRVADYPEDNSFDQIYGDPYYDEEILNKRFRVSYNGFLQNHIEQCDKLYNTILEYSKSCKPTYSQGEPVFLDVCAGSGTIGVCIADQVKYVVAIEMNQASCKDAEVNYQLNNLHNCKIICSKVEDVMKTLSNDLRINHPGCYYVACLDPPRAGVLPVVTDALRTCKGCDDIIYVSCSPSQIIENLIQLCLPQGKRRKAPGFRIKSVVMVDMFPQTNHYEAIFHLERDYLNI